MSLLALLASPTGPTPPHPAPYPTEAPWNARAPLSIPTPEGSGYATHPSVIDMGSGGWNGFRYWMAMTPYPFQSLGAENPCVLVSHDGFVWTVPPGHTNPLRPWGGGDTWQSDTDIEYDPDTGRMWVIWRESEGTPGVPPPGGANLVAVWASWSTNGHTWSTPAHMVDHTISNIPATAEIVSPALVRRASGDWWIFCTGAADQIETLTAPDPMGPWTRVSSNSVPGVGNSWHLDVTLVDDVFLLLVNDRGPWSLRTATSPDGVTWSTATDPLVAVGPSGAWDDRYIYRGTLTLDGEYAYIWYGGVSVFDEWCIGHTRIPRSEFYTL